MSERETVTEEAVEAAASAMWDQDREFWDDCDLIGMWDTQEPEVKASWRPMARAALEAAAPLIVAGEGGWQPIRTYPNCETCGKADCDWGPTVAVLVPTDFGALVPMVAHLEAGMWLATDSEDFRCCADLPAKPLYWSPLPYAIRPDSREERNP